VSGGKEQDREGPPLDGLEGEPYPRCANHPGRAAATTCMDCRRPLCSDCIAYSPRGSKCLECARVPVAVASKRRVVRTRHVVLWGLIGATISGVVFYYVLSALSLFDAYSTLVPRTAYDVLFWGSIFVVGFPVGLTIWESSGHDTGRTNQALGALCATWALIFPPFLALLLPVGFEWQVVFYSWPVTRWLTMLPVAAATAVWVISPLRPV
jgi:hypothetical protein